MTGSRRHPPQRPQRRPRRRIRRLASQQQAAAKEGGGTEQGDHRTATQASVHLSSPPGDHPSYELDTYGAIRIKLISGIAKTKVIEPPTDKGSVAIDPSFNILSEKKTST